MFAALERGVDDEETICFHPSSVMWYSILFGYSYGSSSKPKPCLVQRQAGGGPNDQRPHLVATPKQSLNMAPRNRQVPYT